MNDEAVEIGEVEEDVLLSKTACVFFPQLLKNPRLLGPRSARWRAIRLGIWFARHRAMPFVFAERPLRVYWEVTRACDLACRHCRAAAVPEPSPHELSSAEAERLLHDLTLFGEPLPHLVLTGGDPLKRSDLFDLIPIARSFGFGVSVAPSATPLLTESALQRLADIGVEAISLSLDGSTAARHDAIRAIDGTYDRTLAAAAAARRFGLPFQVNTLVCEETVEDLTSIYETVVTVGASRWSLFFLVSVGRGQVLMPVSSERAETVLQWVVTLNGSPAVRSLVVTTTEAPHVRRIAGQRRPVERANGASVPAPKHGAGIRDGNGVLFISHTGDVTPSGFLELPCGNVRDDDVVEVYRSSPVFKSLRSPTEFGGRCGRCEFHWVCGGSRARAYATYGDPLAEDPLCRYDAIAN